MRNNVRRCRFSESRENCWLSEVFLSGFGHASLDQCLLKNSSFSSYIIVMLKFYSLALEKPVILHLNAAVWTFSVVLLHFWFSLPAFVGY